MPSARCSRTVSAYSSGVSAFQVRTSSTTVRRRASPRKSETRSSSALSRSNSASWVSGCPSSSPLTYHPSGSAPAASRTRQSTRSSPLRDARTVTSARCSGSVAYNSTDRVIPPCHHWSWSSMCEASDHLITVSRTTLRAPARTCPVRSNSAARWESLDTPTGRPSTCTRSTLSAAPTWSTIRRPVHSAGTSTSRSWTPVGLAAGEWGGYSGNGIRTFVYCGRSSVPCTVQAPARAPRTRSRRPARPERAATGSASRRPGEYSGAPVDGVHGQPPPGGHLGCLPGAQGEQGIVRHPRTAPLARSPMICLAPMANTISSGTRASRAPVITMP